MHLLREPHVFIRDRLFALDVRHTFALGLLDPLLAGRRLEDTVSARGPIVRLDTAQDWEAARAHRAVRAEDHFVALHRLILIRG